VIDANGHILTNAHVVQPCARSWPKAKLSVELSGGKKVQAKLVGLDHLADIAVLEITDMAGLGAPLPFADSAAVKTGEEVVAIGYPSFLQLGEEPTLSRGVVSTPSRSFATIGGGVQTDAAINHGNSGGPLLSMRGEVVGVNTIIFGRDSKVENINLAISAKVAQRVSSDILQFGQAKRAFDVLASTILLALASPFLVITALVIKATSPGPVFFRQDRMGRHERTFKILKFRTMFDGAENQRDDLAHMNEVDGPLFKVADDPRITRPGRVSLLHALGGFPSPSWWPGPLARCLRLPLGRRPGHTCPASPSGD
jgi:hypothetical protein